MPTQEWILIAILAVITLSVLFVRYRKTTRQILLDRVKQQAFDLFLFAEKQDWVGPEKMKWAVDKLTSMLPDKARELLLLLIPEDTIEDWLKGVYAEFKSRIKDVLD